MKLIAKTTIRYGDKGETAAPGEPFELDEKKYPGSVESLLKSGDAVKAEKPSTAPPAAGPAKPDDGKDQGKD